MKKNEQLHRVRKKSRGNRRQAANIEVKVPFIAIVTNIFLLFIFFFINIIIILNEMESKFFVSKF